MQVIEVQTSEGSVELGDGDRALLRSVIREINQAAYLLEDELAWSGFPELLSSVCDERTSPGTRVVIRPEQVKTLRGWLTGPVSTWVLTGSGLGLGSRCGRREECCAASARTRRGVPDEGMAAA